MSIDFEAIFNLDEFNDFDERLESNKLNDGDRRRVSILFADIKGYTALSSHLDHEHVKIIVDKLLKAFTICINKFGGFVDKYEGDMIMGLFGAKKASEEDTKRSVLAALEMIEAVQIYNKVLEAHPKFAHFNIDFSIRIGINTGFVTTGKVGEEREGDFTVYGESVNMASRMETNAPINSIMINGETKKIIENDFTFTELGFIDIKGYHKKIEVYTVDSIVEVDNFWSLISTPYFGRDIELKTLIEGLDGDYNREMFHVCGEAGIGKSRLIYEFLVKVFGFHPRELPPNLTLKGYASSIVEQPYYVFKNMLQRYFTYISDEDRLFLDDEYIQYILTDKKSDEIAELNDKEFQLNLSLSIKNFLDIVAKRVEHYGFPLIVIVEDIHAIDESSKVVFDYLLSKFILGYEESIKTVFIFTSREKATPFNTSQNIACTYMHLKKLDQVDILQLINSLDTNNEIRRDIKNTIIEKSGGNPLFIEEWVKDIKEQGNNSTFVPDSLNSLILSNIDRLPIDEKRLLQKASILGKEFNKEFLKKIVEKLEVDYDFESIFASLVAKEFFVKVIKTSEKDLYIFRKFIVQDVSYNTLLIQNREVLHSIVARFLEDENSSLIESVVYDLVYHYGLSNNRKKEIEYLFIAGKFAFKNFQNKKAIFYFEKIKSYENRVTVNIEYIYSLISYSDVYIRIGDFESAKKELQYVVKLAKKHKFSEQLAIAKRCLGEVYVKCGEMTEALVVLNEALEMSKSITSTFLKSRIEGVIGEANFWLGNYEIAKQMFENQYESDVKNSNTIGIIRVLGNLGLVYYRMGDYDTAREKLLNQINLALDFKDKGLIAEAYSRLGIIYIALKDFEFAIVSLSKAKELAEETGDVVLLAKVIGNIGLVHKNQFEFELALVMYKQQEEIARSIKDAMMIAIVSINIGNIYIERKEYDKALEFFRNSYKLMNERKYRDGESACLGNMALCYLKRGYIMKALHHFMKKLDISIEIKDRGEEAVSRLGIAECNLDIGDYDEGIKQVKQSIDISHLLKNDHLSEHYKVLSELYLKKGEFIKAEESFDMAKKSKNSEEFKYELDDLEEKITIAAC